MMRRVGSSDLSVFPLCLGANVFGWTSDEQESFDVLDSYVAAGGNFIDTADVYSAWAPGNSGGESEEIIGRWMAARGNRDGIVLATKVGRLPGAEDLRPATIRRAAEHSLARLQTDHIDLYYAHGDDDESLPIADTLGAFAELIDEGKVRYIAASNYGVARLAEALELARGGDLPPYVALQPHYNLVDRTQYEGPLAALCAREGVACIPYYALARGFLTGKYRVGGDNANSPRAGAASAHLDNRGRAILAALDELAAGHETTVAAVALAWLAAQPTVVTPIASARTPEQLAGLLPMVDLDLSAAELERLTEAATPS